MRTKQYRHFTQLPRSVHRFLILKACCIAALSTSSWLLLLGGPTVSVRAERSDSNRMPLHLSYPAAEKLEFLKSLRTSSASPLSVHGAAAAAAVPPPVMRLRRLVSRIFPNSRQKHYEQQKRHKKMPINQNEIDKQNIDENRQERSKNDQNFSANKMDAIEPWTIFDNQIGKPSASFTGLAAALHGFLSDHPRLARLSISGAQVALALYLGRIVMKSVVEILDDLIEEQQNGAGSGEFGGGGGGIFHHDPLAIKQEELTRVLAFFEQDEDSLRTSLLKSKNKNALPSIAALQLVQDLVAAGLPLRSNDSANGAKKMRTSVESVLSQLTRAELAIMRQCLWTPSSLPIELSSKKSTATDVNDERANTNKFNFLNNSIWGHIIGLQSVKDRLLTAILSLSYYFDDDNNKNQSNLGAQAYAPLINSMSTGAAASTFSLSNTPSPAGILLYGPPGCGKTLLVRALATTARIPCLVVTPSVLLRKFVGETNSQVRTLFSLAHKLAPCILCIDELDGLLRERNENEHEVSRDLKTEFLQWWDGMLSTGRNGLGNSVIHRSQANVKEHSQRPILIIGATNRPFDVDAAVLRRLPQSHFVGLPDFSARLAFLQQLLSQVPVDTNLNLKQVALQTDGYSPSDLKQLVQTAAFLGPLRHLSSSSPSSAAEHPRPLSTLDLMQAIPHAPPTPLSSSYRMALHNFCFTRSSASTATTAQGGGYSWNDHSNPFIMASESISQRNAPSYAGNAWIPTSVRKNNIWNDDLTSDILVWETERGNFYDIGTLHVDSATFDAMTEVISQLDWSYDANESNHNSADYGISDSDDDSDYDDDDSDFNDNIE